MKLFKRFVSWTIWGIIGLNLMLMGISHIPAAQRHIGSFVASMVERELGTRVKVGRVDPGFLNRIIIEDLTIWDQNEKEMVRVARLSAKIDIGPLVTDGKISISSAQLFGAHLSLYRRNAQAKPNFQFVLDSLASKDTTSHTPLDLRINTLIMRHTNVKYDQLDVARTDGKFNPAHLGISDLSANISLRTLTDDSLNVSVKRLGFIEQSGFTLSRLGFHLEAGRQQARLSQFDLEMPSSQLHIDTLQATYLLDKNGLKKGSLTYHGIINNTSVTPSDLRCFEPSLKNSQRPIVLTADFSGTDSGLSLKQLIVSTEQRDIDIRANGWIQNFSPQASWHLQLDNLTFADTSLDFLTKAIPQLPKELTRIGSLQMSGICDRSPQGSGTLKTSIRSGIGNVDIQLDMNDSQAFSGQVETEGINLRQLLDNSKFGNLATKLTVSGQLHDKQKPDVAIDGTIHHLDYDGYAFNDIALGGQYAKGALTGHIAAEAANIKLSDQWDGVTMGGYLLADFTGHNLNDLQGEVHISNFSLSATEKKPAYYLDHLDLSSNFDEGIHFLKLNSDFAEAEVSGQFDYATLLQSIVSALGSKLPTLPGLPKYSRQSNNNFALHLLVTKTDWLHRFLNIDLDLPKPVLLEARVNDNTHELYLDGHMPAFTYNGTRYADGIIRITSPVDTMKCEASITTFTDNGHNLGLKLLANASQNNLTTTLRWDNHFPEKQMSGEFNAIMQLYRNLADKPEAHVRVQPSHIILNNSTWNVEPSDIIYHDNYLLIDHFSLHHNQQHIIIDGIASKHENDSLTVDLNEVEVGYILDLVNFHSVEFSGKATGRAHASSLLGKFAANADLRVDDFKFERGHMGVLHAKANWNQELEQIDINAVADDGPDSKTLINGHVSPIHENIDLAIEAQGTAIAFMHNFTSSFLTSIDGHAVGNARVAGPLDNINLTGQIIVTDGEATVTPLNTTYTLKNDTVVMIPDDIQLRHMALYDRDGHEAFLSGGIHHEHLTSLTFDLEVEAENLLGYDFGDFGDSSFYGTVYASGNVDIHGRDNDVTINCNVTPQPGSVFVYNAASPDAISKQEFIEWESSTTASGTITKTAPARASDTDIYINFLINATPEATVRLLMDAATNDYITLYGDGTIRASFHNKGAFNMFGTYTIDHGTYGITIQNIIKKNFTFNPGGTIIFGGDPYDAALNLQAVYTVNGVSLSDLNIGNSFTNNTIRVNCLMNIGGQPNAPQVDFDLEMPTVNADEQQMVRSVINGQQEMNQQVLYLLGIGRFYNQGNNNSNSERPDQTSLAMQSFLSGTLSTQINTLLSQFIKNDNWSFGANISTGNEGWHNAEYEGIINGRMLHNRLLFNGQFGYRDNATQANPSFIGDFDVQYLLLPNGNLALKVYNQTNDRYFTKSSLNTQGIGLIMKKDFDGFGDLFSSKKKKKKREKK